jgi:type II secretory pathway predicted ATPase ExeA
MFLDHFRLESNPFAANQVRPKFQSCSSRLALVRLERILDQVIHCLFLSGPAGVGKSALVERRLREIKDTIVVLIGPAVSTPEKFLEKIRRDVGLPPIDVTTVELRNILEVFLRHQASKGTSAIFVVDSLERLAEPVLNELRWLMGLRFKKRSVVRSILVTRSEELVAELMPQEGGNVLTPYIHHRLGGFNHDETYEYVKACLHSVGCQDAAALISNDVIFELQSYTNGIVGDINALCFESFNLLAERSKETDAYAGLDRNIIAEAAKALNLRYDPMAWQYFDEALSASSVQQSDPGELTLHAAHLLVTSRGNVVASVPLNRPRMVLGRDDGCDISLDSRYVSRFQNLFFETEKGWVLFDLNSTNGCYVNGRRVTQHELQDGDIIAVGHHQISFVGPLSRRPSKHADISPTARARIVADDTLIERPVMGKAESA